MTPPVVALLYDAAAAHGPPDASDTLKEAAAIAAALEELGFEPVAVPVGLDLAALRNRLRELAPRAAFNLVESLEGNGRLLHLVPALLAALELPFTGCSATSLALTSDKVLAKHALRRAGLPTPPLFGDPAAEATQWIVKSLYEHSSLGIDDASVVSGRAAVEAALHARRAQFGGKWFAEGFVPGRELNVALLSAGRAPRALPIAEIRFQDFPAGKPRIVGYAAKWDESSFEYRNTVRTFGIEAALGDRVRDLALECWSLFELGGYARVDFRVDPRGEPWILEVNANPCLAPDAGFAAAAAEAGIDYHTLVAAVLEDALPAVGAPR
ncbi:MAG TPA: ATP-grasp domain-containing protein [Gammaproteobacteria bacterium]|nr:ATP-grasp domain-containing protein [Gammaproteobacteria bacterium]